MLRWVRDSLLARQLAFALLACVAALVLAASVPLSGQPMIGQPMTDQSASTTEQPVDGAAVYQATCAACHGTTGGGRSGDDVTAGPALRGLQLAYVDMTLRTGRMPLSHPPVGVWAGELDDTEREALVEWARTGLALTGEIPQVGPGDSASGRVLYVRHCAACHGATGEGGIAGGDTRVPSLVGHDAVAVVEAIRVGPFEMPVFGDQVITDEEADDIAAYVVGELDDHDSTPLGLAEVGSVTALVYTVIVGGVLFAALLVVARLGRRGMRGRQ